MLYSPFIHFDPQTYRISKIQGGVESMAASSHFGLEAVEKLFSSFMVEYYFLCTTSLSNN